MNRRKEGTGKALKVLRVNFFSIRLKKSLCDTTIKGLIKRLEDEGAIPQKNIYINNSFMLGSSLYCFETKKDSDDLYKTSVHIASMRHKNVKNMMRKEILVKELKECSDSNFTVEFGSENVPWLQWQKVPSLSLVQYLNQKGYDLVCSA